jgi:hypothetical protein
MKLEAESPWAAYTTTVERRQIIALEAIVASLQQTNAALARIAQLLEPQPEPKSSTKGKR